MSRLCFSGVSSLHFLQSFVMFIRHVSGTKYTVADWLSRMHAYLSSERALCMMSEEHGDIGCLISCLQKKTKF